MTRQTMEQVAAALAAQLPQGVFLCVGGERPNVMAMGWGGLNYYWKRYVIEAPVRPQRFTHPQIERERAFAVCVPKAGEMGKALAQAGSLSGRDGDKFKAMGLATRPAREINAPLVEGCAWYLECRVRAVSAFTQESTGQDIIDDTYQAGDFHTLFYGEVVACYPGEAQ